MDSSTTNLDPSSLNNALNGSGGGLIPESLVAVMTVGFILINILGLLFFIAYVAVAIRNWKVQSAIFQMQKDLADVKQRLSSTHEQNDRFAPASTNDTPIAPAESNKTVASTEPRSEVS